MRSLTLLGFILLGLVFLASSQELLSDGGMDEPSSWQETSESILNPASSHLNIAAHSVPNVFVCGGKNTNSTIRTKTLGLPPGDYEFTYYYAFPNVSKHPTDGRKLTILLHNKVIHKSQLEKIASSGEYKQHNFSVSVFPGNNGVTLEVICEYNHTEPVVLDSFSLSLVNRTQPPYFQVLLMSSCAEYTRLRLFQRLAQDLEDSVTFSDFRIEYCRRDSSGKFYNLRFYLNENKDPNGTTTFAVQRIIATTDLRSFGVLNSNSEGRVIDPSRKAIFVSAIFGALACVVILGLMYLSTHGRVIPEEWTGARHSVVLGRGKPLAQPLLPEPNTVHNNSANSLNY